MRFRFTLSHEVLGSLEISEPDAWKSAVLKLERHEEFHSLIEYFDGSFIFYGDNGIVNGGINFIKEVELLDGVDATILIDIDVTFDDVSFSNVFNGQFKLADLEEMPNNKMRLPIIRDDFWSKFISRLDTPVNLQSFLDLDDENVTVAEQVILELSSQKIKQIHSSNFIEGLFIDDNDTDYLDQYIQINPDNTILDEIEVKYTLPNAVNSELPAWVFEMTYAGEYIFDLRIEASQSAIITPADNLNGYVEMFIKINEDAPIQFVQTDFGGGGGHESTVFSYSATHNLNSGDIVRIYGLGILAITGAFRVYIWGQENSAIEGFALFADERPSGAIIPTYFSIVAHTIFPQTRNEGFLVHDVAAAITDRTIGQTDTFYSELLGSQYTRARQYLQDGCAWKYGIIKGLQLRQYNLTEKPFFQSFNQWWRGINPILNLSLSYETVQIPEIIDVSPDVNLIEDLANWSNSPGGGWDFITFGHPFVSVGGNGGIEPYAVGEAVFNEDQIYYFEVNTFIQTTGSSTPEAVVTFAILDAGYNELATQEFNYVGPGNKPETFTLIPSGVGAFFGIKIVNNTPVDTKNFELTLAFSEVPQIVYHEETVIRVEEKVYQYDESDGTSVDFSNVWDITRKYDNDRIFNKVEIGYTRWQSEDVSGIDDPQSKKTYATRFKKVGKSIQLYSEWMAASLAIEQTRRTTREKSADYKYDNETFIIALNPLPQDESPDTSPDYLHFDPELDENFSSVTNLLNSETRYNLRLTPARNFLRWQNYLQGALQVNVGSDFKFSSAEGNYDMTSTMDDGGCLNDAFNGVELSEKENIQVTTDYIHLAQLYEFSIPMDWSDYVLIRDNRRKPIGVSQSNTGHVNMFIKTLEFKPVEGSATILAWAKEFLELSVVADTTPMQECMPESDDCETALTDTNGNILTNELGICIYA